MELSLLIWLTLGLTASANGNWDSTVTYNNGQWTPSPTTTAWVWTPTTTPTSYWYGYTSYTYTTYTSCYTVGTVIVTITSIVPCPVYVTETSIVYECDTCTTNPPPPCEECESSTILTGVVYSTPVTTYTESSSILTGVVYNTPVTTYTSDGIVVVVVGTVTPTPAQTQVQVIYASRAGKELIWDSQVILASIVLGAGVLTCMILL